MYATRRLLRRIVSQRGVPRSHHAMTAMNMMNRRRRNINTSTIGLVSSALILLGATSVESKETTLRKELEKIDETWENDMESAATVLASLQAEYPNNPEILWRRARVVYNIGFGIEDTNAKTRRFQEAMDFCTEALKYGSNISAAHKWYAIVLSELSGLQGTKSSIQSSYEVYVVSLSLSLSLSHTHTHTDAHSTHSTNSIYRKEHFERAAELDPEDPNCWHFLGRWSFTIASIGWWSRQIASTIFATPPQSSFEEALDFFEKAEAIRPGFWKANNLFIAKCHQQLGNNEKALEWLKKANGLPTNTAEDIQTQEEVSALIEKLKPQN